MFMVSVITSTGVLYLWGQTKNTGEANMYPKPINDLSGWNIRGIGCWFVLKKCIF